MFLYLLMYSSLDNKDLSNFHRSFPLFLFNLNEIAKIIGLRSLQNEKVSRKKRWGLKVIQSSLNTTRNEVLMKRKALPFRIPNSPYIT